MYRDGEISSGTDSPIVLQAGQPAQLALQPDRAAPGKLVLVAGRQRDRDLEEIYQRLQQASEARRPGLGAKLQARLEKFRATGAGAFHHSLAFRSP